MHLGELLQASEPVLSERSAIIASYALCGFANFASIGIQLGGIGGIAPERMSELAEMSIRAMIGGSLAAFMTATVAGVVVDRRTVIESWKGIRPDIHPSCFVHPSAVHRRGDPRPPSQHRPGTVLRGDMGPIVIEEEANIQDNSVIHNTGGICVTRVGPRVTVGHRCILHGCTVGEGALVGMGVCSSTRSSVPAA